MSTPAHLPHVPPPAARINTVQANFNVTAAQGKLSAPELLLAITRSQILPALSDLLESPPYSELVLTLAHVEIDLGRWPDDPNWPDVRHVLTQKLRAILDPHLQKTPQLVVQTVPALQASRTFKGHEIFAYILAKAPADQTGALNAALRDDSSLRAQAMANPKLATLLSKFTVRVLLESIDPYAPNHQLATLLAYVAANPVTLPDLMQALVDTPSQMAGLLAAARLQPGLIAQYGTLEQLLTKVAENPATLNTIAAQSRFLHNQTRVLAKKLLAQIPTHPKSLQIVRKFLSQYPALTNTLVALIADISLPKRIFSPQIKDIDTLLLYMTTALDKLHHSLNAATIVQVTFATHLNVQLTLSALAGLSPPKQFAYLLKLIATDPAALALLGQHDTTLDKTQLAASLRLALETAQQYTASAQSPAPVGKINNGQIPPKLILNDGTANQSNLQITYPSETPILRPKDSPKLCLDRSVSRHIWGLLRHFKEKSSTLILEKHDVGTHTVAELSDVLHRVFSASPDPESLPEAQQAKVKRKASSDADRNPLPTITRVQIRTILTQITHLAPPEQPAVLIALIAAHPATLSTLEQPETLTILSNLSPELQATITQFSAVTESDRRALLDRWNALPFSHNASNEIVRLLQTLEMNQRASDNHKARPAQQNSAEQIDSVLEMIANGQREPTVAAFISPVSPDIDIPSLAAQPTSALTPVQIRTILTQITHLAPPEQPAVLIALIAAHPATLSTLEQPETLTILSNLSPELQATIAQFDQTQRHDTPLLHLQRMMRTQPYHNIRTAINWIKQAAQGWPDLLAQIAPTPPEWLSVLLTDDAPTPSLPAQIITAQRDLHAYLLNVGTETDTAHETAARISALWALLTTTKSQQANTQDTDLTALWTSAPFEIVSRLIALPNKTKQLQFLEAAGLDWGSVLRQEAVSRTALSTLWKTNRAAMLAAIRWITPSEQSALLNRLLPEGATLLHNALTLMLSITAAPEVVMRRAITALLDGTSMDLEAFSRQSKLIVSPQVVLMKAFGIGGAIIEPLATRDLDLDLDLDQTTPDMPPQLLAMLPQMIDIIVPRRVQQTFITFYSAWPSASLVTKPNPALTRLAEMSDQPAPVLNALLAEVLHPITDETDIHSQITRLIVTLEPDTFRRDAHLRLVVARLTTVSPSSDPDTRALRNAARTAAQHILNQRLNAEQPVQLTPYTPTTLWDTEAAGLVIFHPYIGLLFNRLGVKPVEKQLPLSLIPRAIAILEALCGSPHSSDPLYNVLLGRHPDATTPLKPVTLHDDDMTLIVSLTRSVIARWGKLGATSPEGLQATFINRTASLELRDDSVILNVSMGPYDMLLDNLPWPLSPIALSWMPHPLHVNWRNEHV